MEEADVGCDDVKDVSLDKLKRQVGVMSVVCSRSEWMASVCCYLRYSLDKMLFLRYFIFVDIFQNILRPERAFLSVLLNNVVSRCLS